MKEVLVVILVGIFSSARSQQLPLARSLPCSIRGVALVGGDLGDSDGGGGFAAGDAAECQYECDRRANCNFWSHVQEWKVSSMSSHRDSPVSYIVTHGNQLLSLLNP